MGESLQQERESPWALTLTERVPEAFEIPPSDWPEKYFSGQSEGGISNASGTRSVRERVQISGGNPMIGIGTDQFPDCSESVCVGWALSAVPIPMRSVPI